MGNSIPLPKSFHRNEGRNELRALIERAIREESLSPELVPEMNADWSRFRLGSLGGSCMILPATRVD